MDGFAGWWLAAWQGCLEVDSHARPGRYLAAAQRLSRKHVLFTNMHPPNLCLCPSMCLALQLPRQEALAAFLPILLPALNQTCCVLHVLPCSYRAKKLRRSFQKKVRYECRKVSSFLLVKAVHQLAEMKFTPPEDCYECRKVSAAVFLSVDAPHPGHLLPSLLPAVPPRHRVPYSFHLCIPYDCPAALRGCAPPHQGPLCVSRGVCGVAGVAGGLCLGGQFAVQVRSMKV